jgi:hypothetical protein
MVTNKKTNTQFIGECREKYGEQYDLSVVEYTGAHEKIKIGCPVHGFFEQSATNFLYGKGCPKCSREKQAEIYRKDERYFIEKAKKVHGDRYDYSKVVYKDAHSKVTIICPEHGEFILSPRHHYDGQGCPGCAQKKRWEESKIRFIERSKNLWDGKYCYSKVEWEGHHTPVTIICPEHGEFKQKPKYHIEKKEGCKQCHRNKTVTTKEYFLNMARECHGDSYDYSKVEYIDMSTKITIICPIHGEFEQMPTTHVGGAGCSKCGYEKNAERLSKGKDGFIKEAREVHGQRYDYSNLVYTGVRDKLNIICPVHGEFEQVGYVHLQGSHCPKCTGHAVQDLDYYLDKANDVHGDRYDYSLIKTFNHSREKVKIICPVHGVFEQYMYSHLSGSGCPRCAKLRCGVGKNEAELFQPLIEELFPDVEFQYEFSPFFVDA